MLDEEEIIENQEKIQTETNRGIYFLIKNEEIVYVGKSESDIFGRVKQHKKSKDFDGYYCKLIPDKEVDLEYLESLYIGKFIPKYNKNFSDRDNFTHVCQLNKLDLEEAEQITKLSVDLASFRNISDKRAFEAITGAITGESEAFALGAGVYVSLEEVKERIRE